MKGKIYVTLAATRITRHPPLPRKEKFSQN